MTTTQIQLFQSMLALSFVPRDWFDGRGDYEEDEEEEPMWVYRVMEVTGPMELFEVGYYTPDGYWFKDCDGMTREHARMRVHWLNGGSATKKRHGIEQDE